MYIVNGAVLERWSNLTDEQIVAQVVAGQTALFELLMRRHHERLYCAAWPSCETIVRQKTWFNTLT